MAAAFLSMFTVFGIVYSFGAFFDSMAKDFGTGKGATALMFSHQAGLRRIRRGEISTRCSTLQPSGTVLTTSSKYDRRMPDLAAPSRAGR